LVHHVQIVNNELKHCKNYSICIDSIGYFSCLPRYFTCLVWLLFT